MAHGRRLVLLRAVQIVIPFIGLALMTMPLAAQRGDADVLRVRNLDELGIDVAIEPPVVGPLLRTATAGARRPAIMLTGYWPPSNEMLRPFSDDPLKNPAGWIGADWEGRGYDVYAYFPEFSNPDCMSCGKGSGELQVDYQDTSEDFWPLADGIRPVAIVTFSRGFLDTSWEVEMNQLNRTDWLPDFDAPTLPTPNPPDASVPVDFLRPSNLPVQQIVDAVDALGFNIDPYICFTGDGGGFLSEFIAYHGVWYRDLHASAADPAFTVAAGHVHVGAIIPVGRARQAAMATLREVIDFVDPVLTANVCQTDLGFGGPGSATLSMCGDALGSGGAADLLLSGAPPNAPAVFVFGLASDPTPFKGGLLVPVPVLATIPLITDPEGAILIPGIAGGGGPVQVYVQAVLQDAAQPFGLGLSNALEVAFEP